jgi:hypothetical protein
MTKTRMPVARVYCPHCRRLVLRANARLTHEDGDGGEHFICARAWSGFGRLSSAMMSVLSVRDCQPR